jgi:hypothetical protein
LILLRTSEPWQDEERKKISNIEYQILNIEVKSHEPERLLKPEKLVEKSAKEKISTGR